MQPSSDIIEVDPDKLPNHDVSDDSNSEDSIYKSEPGTVTLKTLDNLQKRLLSAKYVF